MCGVAAAPVTALGGICFCAGQLEEEDPSQEAGRQQPRTEKTLERGMAKAKEEGWLAAPPRAPKRGRVQQESRELGANLSAGRYRCHRPEQGQRPGGMRRKPRRGGLRNEEARHRQPVTDSFLACLLGWRRARDRGAQ